MARLFVTDINLNKNELQNARIQNLSTAPSAPVTGQVYYNTTDNILYFWNGTEFIPTSGSLEVIQDAINSTIVAGVGLDKTYDDGGNTYTLDIDSTVATLTGTQTLTNKTLTSPVISTIVNTGTVTIPSSTDTLVGRATTDTLTNKSISLANNTVTSTLAQLNTAVTDADIASLAGSETLTNKTLTSPVLGGTTTTASGNLVVKPATNILEVQGDGSAVVGQLQLNCHVNSHGQKIASQPHSQNATNTLKLPGGTAIGNADAVLVSDTGIQTLTNKTLTSPVVTGLDATTTDKGLASFATADFTVASGAVTIKNVNLGTQTTGDYVANIQGTANEVTVSPTSGEGTSVTIGLPDDVTITNSLTVGGNLTVNGTVTSVNTETTTLNDNIIVLNNNETGAPSQNAGLEVERGTSANVSILWNESSDQWTASNNGTDYHAITRKFSSTIGNGSLTQIPVTHNLDTRTVTVEVYDSATYNTVECDVVRTSTTVVTLGFTVAPAAGAYTVVIVG